MYIIYIMIAVIQFTCIWIQSSKYFLTWTSVKWHSVANVTHKAIFAGDWYTWLGKLFPSLHFTYLHYHSTFQAYMVSQSMNLRGRNFPHYSAHTALFAGTEMLVGQTFPIPWSDIPVLSQYIPGVHGVSADEPAGQKFPAVHCPPWAVTLGWATSAPDVQYHPGSHGPVGVDSPCVSQYSLQNKDDFFRPIHICKH